MTLSNDPRPLRLGRILHNVRREGVPQESPVPNAATAPNVPADDAAPADVAMRGMDKARVDAAYQQGRNDGRAEAVRELSQAVQVLRNAAHVYEAEKARLIAEADDQSITLALAVVRKILGREVKDGELLRNVLRRALAQAPQRQALRARLHPDDLRAIEASRSLLRQTGEPLPEELVLCADPSIARGGCVLESPSGQVDARLDTQLELIEKALRGLEPQGIDDGSTNRSLGPGTEA